MNLSAHILKIAKAAREASYSLALISTQEKNAALKAMAQALVKNQNYLIKENAKDLKAAQGYSKALVDRLTLNSKTIKGMADSLLETISNELPLIGSALLFFTYNPLTFLL